MILVAVLTAVPAFTMPAEGQSTTPLTFERGQAVYVVAFTNDGKADLTAETELAREFEKDKIFKPAQRLEDSSFVFALFADYQITERGRSTETIMTSAVAMALAPDDYRTHRGDMEALRGAAAWRELVSNGGWRGVSIVNGRSSLAGRAVDRFNDMALKKK
jgi:hypothetical protein